MFTIARARIAAFALLAGATLFAPMATYAATPDALDLHSNQGQTTTRPPTNIPQGPVYQMLNLKVDYVGVVPSQNNHTFTYTYHVTSTGGVAAQNVKLETNCVWGQGSGLQNQLGWQTIGTIPANSVQTYTVVCHPTSNPNLGSSLKVYTSTQQSDTGDDWATS